MAEEQVESTEETTAVGSPVETQDKGEANASTPQDASQGDGTTTPPAEGNESTDDKDIVTDDQGRKFIPYEAFEARLAKLTEQKYSARDQFLEALKNDPAVKQDVIKALGINPEATAPNPEPEKPTKFQEFLAPLPPEHQAHYQGLISSIVPEFQEFVKEQLDAALGPIIATLGEERLNKFKSSVPDFDKYAPNIEQLVGKPISLEQAYILESHKDKLKGVGAAKQKQAASVADKSKNLPVKGPNLNPSFVNKNVPEDLHEALRQAARNSGYLTR